jgi:uncharacterized membrane protein
MIFPLLVHILKVQLLGIVTNHLVNIPLVLVFGLGKYFAFFIAIIIDIIQMVIYYNVLNNTSLGKKMGWVISSKYYDGYKKPKFIDKLHDSWLYLGVFMLAFLPIYFGGIFASVFTAHLLKLNKRKSFFITLIGSVCGCFVWTVGIWSVIELFIQAGKSLF